jgi:AcrR family transcriptional regulator
VVTAEQPRTARAPKRLEEVTLPKATRTRAAIIDAALRLFRERGYDATTMRAIATEAGVSVGNAYYYFDSKEQLIQGFYDRIQVEHAAATAEILKVETGLAARVASVGLAWVTIVDPYRPFAGKFFKNAAEPTSPLSPFSLESGGSRDAAVGLWRDVVLGSDVAVPESLREELPEVLWIVFMGFVLIWVHDRTEGAAATRRLIERGAPILEQAIRLATLPGMESTLGSVVGLMDDIRQAFAVPPEEPGPSGDDAR